MPDDPDLLPLTALRELPVQLPGPADARARGTRRHRRQQARTVLAVAVLASGVALGAGALTGTRPDRTQVAATSPTMPPEPSPLQDSTPSPTPTPMPSSKPTPSSEPTPLSPPSPTNAVVAAESGPASGTDIGFLKAVETERGKTLLRWDRVQFLTGAKAQAYATAHGFLVANDYVLLNDNPTLRTYRLARGARIRLIPTEPSSFKETTDPQQLAAELEHPLFGTLYDLVFSADRTEVVDVTQHYTP